MRVLVTGASGFSGGHVARYLDKSGHEIVRWRRDWSPAFLPKVDAIVHIAGTFQQPTTGVGQLLNDNVCFTQDVIGHALTCFVKKLIFFSSLSVYGDVEGAVVHDQTPIHNPTPYGVTKLLCEQMLNDVANVLPSVSLRLPGIVGRGAHFNWLSQVARSIVDRKPVLAYGLDNPFNNAIHIDDLCVFINHLLEHDWSGNRSIVLGAETVMSVRDVISQLAKDMGLTAEIQSLGDREGFILTSERAKKYYGYVPAFMGSIINRYAADMLAEPMQLVE